MPDARLPRGLSTMNTYDNIGKVLSHSLPEDVDDPRSQMCSDQTKMSAATLYNSKGDKRESVQEIQGQFAQNICLCNVYLKGDDT